MFKPTLPSNDAARSLIDVQSMLGEAKVFSKNLKKYHGSVTRFSKATDMLLVDAGKVVTGTSGTTIDNIRSGLLTELESGVQKPMAEWQGTYAAVKQDAKALAKLANSYGKCEHAMIAAQGKCDKGQQAGIQEAKLAKLTDKASARATAYETAKVAYESAAPSVVTKCQQLLRQRDILQVSLFSTFAISGDALQRMVTLRPDVEVASDNHSGKLPTDLSLPFNPESPSAGSSPYAEPQASYAPPAYLNKGTPSPGAMSTSTGQNTTWHPASIALAAAACLSLSLSPLVSPAHAVSGGKGISSSLAFSDQSGKDLRGVQLTKADLRGTNFSKSDLSNSILFGALAEGADFSFSILRESDLEGANFFDASLEGAILEGAQVAGTRFGGKINIKDSDWTDVLLRKDVRLELCRIATGVNPTTGVNTRESLGCQ